jgi:primosomal protein N' (replication factor Y)
MPLVSAWRVDRPFDYLVPEALRGRVRTGSLVRVPFGHRRVRGVVVEISDSREPPTRELQEVAALVLEDPVCPHPLEELAGWVARRYVAQLSRTFERFVPPRVRVRPVESRPASALEARTLTAYRGGRELLHAVESGAAGTWCFRPLPGEDRGRAIAELVAATGRSSSGAALVCVPELRYGSAVLDALEAFHPGAARVESTRPELDRASAWMALARGAPLGAGGRGAVFAPAPDLRLIVVDEEQHNTYKEDRSPRFDAVRVAQRRARLQGAACVLVAATPSLETGAAVLEGRIGSVEPERVRERSVRPMVEVVEPPEDRSFSRALLLRIREALREGRKAGLLVPGRGFSRSLWCAACRKSVRCPRCEAGMAYDRTPRRVRCPRCGLSAPPPDSCPSCGSVEFRYLGAGSERLAEQLASAFPRARVARVDQDVISKAEEARVADIYVTTWIGTKESLRPDVGVVGVLDADWLVRRPDFRAAERAHEALAEMAEWAGPAAAGGRLVLQTREPGHHAVQAVVRGDYRFFLTRELAYRRELGYPPFSELIKVTATGPDKEALVEQAASSARTAGGRVLGPVATRTPGAPPGLEILIKCPDAGEVALGLRSIVEKAAGPSRLLVDVDPR